MAAITLKDITVPQLQITNKRMPNDEKFTIALQYGIRNDYVISQDSCYAGFCKITMTLESEKELDAKTFEVIVEVVGIFEFSSESLAKENKKDAVMRDLLPHANAILSASMAIAKVPTQLIPTSLLAQFE